MHRTARWTAFWRCARSSVSLLLTSNEAAAALRISPRLLWSETKRGEIPCVRLGKAVRYSVLGAWDSDPDAHRIAYKTPLGQALMGKKVGEHVKLKIGTAHQEFQIAGITRYADAKKA